MEIIPAIMPENYEDLREKLSQVSHSVKTVQIDVMDGRFVSSRSWPYNRQPDPDFEKVLHEEEGLPFWERLNFEIDLMVDNPSREASKWILAGATRLAIHLESQKENLKVALEEIKNGGVEVGLAMDMKTPVEELWPFLDCVDFVQLMGIKNIGYQGEPFDGEVVGRIKSVKERSPSTIVSVDGGVSLETAPAILAAGAERLVIGSAIFDSADVEGAIHDFQSL